MSAIEAAKGNFETARNLAKDAWTAYTYDIDSKIDNTLKLITANQTVWNALSAEKKTAMELQMKQLDTQKADRQTEFENLLKIKNYNLNVAQENRLASNPDNKPQSARDDAVEYSIKQARTLNPSLGIQGLTPQQKEGLKFDVKTRYPELSDTQINDMLGIAPIGLTILDEALNNPESLLGFFGGGSGLTTSSSGSNK
jgi:hypothetical protein